MPKEPEPRPKRSRGPSRRKAPDQQPIPTRPSPEHDDAHELMPNWLRAQLPKLYSTEKQQDPVAQVKYFTPDSQWTWYVTEFDGQDLLFGLVEGFEREIGYFSLAEMQQARGPYGLQIERDLYFNPTPLSKLQGNQGDSPD